MHHLDLETLDRLAHGSLDGALLETAARHLSTCEDCRSRRNEVLANLGLAQELQGIAIPSQWPEAAASAPMPGARVSAAQEGERSSGAYTLRRIVGRGGMGVVYEAQQDTPRRRVAVKLLGQGIADGPHVDRMLRREAQALGRLEHPHVARIHEAGRFPDGRAFLAMEFVEGRSLTSHAREEQLARPARLGLFLDLCDAIAYAHQRGVIHRDLKPSNVLVDREGCVKVLDFGLARLLEPEDGPFSGVDPPAGASLSFGEGHILGTLPYMSPEQVRGDTHAIDARSDVYSLGVMLYELLLDRLPYRMASRSLLEGARVICTVEPDLPSAVDRSLRGDLETIVLAALKKQPSERYATVAALRDDMRRYLAHEPILARPPALLYQLGKLVRRHRLFFGGLAALFLAAVAVGLWTSALYRDTDLQRRLAERTALEREREAIRARTLVGLLDRMLGAADPHEAKGADYTVRALLDDFAGQLGTTLAAEPLIEAALRGTLARAYRKLGLPARAEPQLVAALALVRAGPEPDGETAVELMEEQAWCLHDRGLHAEAEQAFRAALEGRRRLHGERDARVAGAQYGVADALRHRGILGEAEEQVAAALALWSAEGVEDLQRISALSLVAELRRARGDLPGAEQTAREALAASVAARGERHVTSAALHNNLAVILKTRGNFDEADAHLREAIDARLALAGPDDAAIAQYTNNLGELRRAQGRTDEAEELHRRALDLRRRVLPAGHLELAESLNNLAIVLHQKGRALEASEHMDEALAVQAAVFGESSPRLAPGKVNLAVLLRAAQRLDEAEAVCRGALAIQRAERVPADDLAYTLLTLGGILRERGALEEAVSLLRESLELRIALYGDAASQVAEARMSLGAALIGPDGTAEAEEQLRRAVSAYLELFGEEDRRTAQARTVLGRCLVAMERPEAAEAEWLAAHGVLARLLGAGHARTLDTVRGLVSLYESTGREESAGPWRALLPAVAAPANHGQ